MAESNAAFFTRTLLHWNHHNNDRKMPWKGEADPYKIWLSEIILQQTRVQQGWAYYERFVAAFPTVYDLAAAEDDRVMKLWEGLGYYARARNLLHSARYIVDTLHGQLPRTADAWRQLKGVGPYTAAAIASFAFNEPVAVIDGNVTRILSRFFGIHQPVDTPQGQRQIAALARQLLPEGNARTYNQAIMDFGALVCTPKTPKCAVCPLQEACAAQREKLVGLLPVKVKKLQRKTRYFHYIVFHHEGRLYLQKRDGNDIWRGLYEFPLIETGKGETLSSLRQLPEWKVKTMNASPHRISGPYAQQLTHQNIVATFYAFSMQPPQEVPLIAATPSEITTFAFPKIIDFYLKDKTLYLSID